MAGVGEKFLMPDPECYIFLHHVKNKNGGYGVYLLLPSYADSLNDSIGVSFQSSTPLSRSAPIYSYENSGPRSLQVHFDLHRDVMYQLNYQNSNANVKLSQVLNEYSVEGVSYTTNDALDYVDIMAREIQAAALPSYNATQKMVNPPLVSMKLGDDIFITGIVEGSVGVTYGLPIINKGCAESGGKYAQVQIDFTLKEVIPYTADSVMRLGSFRGRDMQDLFSRSKYTYGSNIGVTAAGAVGLD